MNNLTHDPEYPYVAVFTDTRGTRGKFRYFHDAKILTYAYKGMEIVDTTPVRIPEHVNYVTWEKEYEGVVEPWYAHRDAPGSDLWTRDDGSGTTTAALELIGANNPLTFLGKIDA